MITVNEKEISRMGELERWDPEWFEVVFREMEKKSGGTIVRVYEVGEGFNKSKSYYAIFHEVIAGDCMIAVTKEKDYVIDIPIQDIWVIEFVDDERIIGELNKANEEIERIKKQLPDAVQEVIDKVLRNLWKKEDD